MTNRVRARATIHLPSLGAGRVAKVDPSDPYVALCIEKGYLVPLEAQRPVEPTVPVEEAVEPVPVVDDDEPTVDPLAGIPE